MFRVKFAAAGVSKIYSLAAKSRTFTALNFVFELAKSKDTSKFSG